MSKAKRAAFQDLAPLLALSAFSLQIAYANKKHMNKLYTTESAAEYLGVTPSRVRQLILEERLDSEKHGRDHLITEECLILYKTTGKKRPGRKPQK